jgi:hypothetical protein
VREEANDEASGLWWIGAGHQRPASLKNG